jgi:hypothetical protein
LFRTSIFIVLARNDFATLAPFHLNRSFIDDEASSISCQVGPTHLYTVAIRTVRVPGMWRSNDDLVIFGRLSDIFHHLVVNVIFYWDMENWSRMALFLILESALHPKQMRKHMCIPHSSFLQIEDPIGTV